MRRGFGLGFGDERVWVLGEGAGRAWDVGKLQRKERLISDQARPGISYPPSSQSPAHQRFSPPFIPPFPPPPPPRKKTKPKLP